MLEENSYVRCLLIDFSKAFDVVRRSILLSNISRLNLQPMILSWIIAFLTGRSQVSKTPGGTFSDPQPLALSKDPALTQYFGLSCKSDLRPLSDVNVIFK